MRSEIPSVDRPLGDARPFTTTTSERLVLEILGLTELEEQIYLYLLDTSDRSEGSVAVALGIPARSTRRAIESLISHGLAVRSSIRSQDVVPHPPDIALEALIRRRQEELERVRLRVLSLESSYRQHTSDELDQSEIEIVEDGEKLLQRFVQAQTIAKDEIRIVRMRPPLEARLIEIERDALARGIAYRSIQSTEDLGRSGGLETIRALVSAGEEARLVPAVAFELQLVDRRVAVVELPSPAADGGSLGWVVRAGPILDILNAHFESLWSAAQEVTRARLMSATIHELTDDERNLLALLGGGLTDDAIGRNLDLAPRTVQRRVSRLLGKLGARSRFQAGVEASRRGWV